ncbi:hypothetical protein [Coleofasciculus sp. E1-EBD-02]
MLRLYLPPSPHLTHTPHPTPDTRHPKQLTNHESLTVNLMT